MIQYEYFRSGESLIYITFKDNEKGKRIVPICEYELRKTVLQKGKHL
jgi:hypothetical protein